MEKPTATYRVQLNSGCDFKKLESIIPYLSQLGISHIYASPIFAAKGGSMHGYDITDHNTINEELGGLDAFEELSRELAAYGLGWIQDIVSNHISYSPQNRIISDIMELGASSTYYSYPDVDWNHPSRRLKGRMLAPFLRDSYRECLQNHELGLVYSEGLVIRYHGDEFPVKLDTYKNILPHAIWTAMAPAQSYHDMKHKLRELYNSDETVRKAVDQAVKRINSDPKALSKILSSQTFALTHWKTALKKINYRRFFDVIDLICLHMERKEVFDATHRLLFKLMSDGKVTGLRIDHIDGLYDPEEYLERLRESAPDTYVILEKILMGEEDLPDSWPAQGTTGYDFMRQANSVFIETKSEAEFDAIYGEFVGKDDDYSQVAYRCRQLVTRMLFGGDVENLARMFSDFMKQRPYGKECDPQKLKQAVSELLCSFTVYRTYLNENNPKDWNSRLFREALSSAKQKNKNLLCELVALEQVLEESNHSRDALQLVMRLQQFTGSVMAKGIEDTGFYVYNRLLSLNEVGGNPKTFGCTADDFHGFNLRRQRRWSYSMNATSTHDTKRGEDVRARLNVLSEMPSEFQSVLKRWSELNLRRKRRIGNKLVPTRNEEYYIYQTLLGAFPFDQKGVPAFTGRMKTHMVKALREAKTNSAWIDPNQEYEEATVSFVSELLHSNGRNCFLDQFLPFQKKIAFYGFLNSLAQTLLKITTPGIPDFYQGSELWNLSLVDPDNRGPVDFEKRINMLEKVVRLKTTHLNRLLKSYEDGMVKLYEIQKALQTRKQNKKIFEQGAYIPLKTRGTRRNHIISFCRTENTHFAITVVPRLMSNLAETLEIPKRDVWNDTCIVLPENAPRNWIETFTQEKLSTSRIGGSVALEIGDLLQRFPVALLTSNDG